MNSRPRSNKTDFFYSSFETLSNRSLQKFGKKWLAELPSVIWSLRNTPSRATGFTPFFLVYGAEAILPTDLEYGSPRLQAYNEQSNRTTREDALDQLEEA